MVQISTSAKPVEQNSHLPHNRRVLVIATFGRVFHGRCSKEALRETMCRENICIQYVPFSMTAGRANTQLAPMLDAVEYQELNFDNDFRHETVYRGTPSFELERAWETLWNRT